MPSSLIATFVVLAVASVIGVIVAWIAFTAEESISEPSAEAQYDLALKFAERIEQDARSTRRQLAGAGR
jgi:hypothetical protein